ncbi:MAG: methionyl-tRNA formyltransferase [Clostridia bacterium]
MGTPEFAKESLKSIYESGYDIVGVFTNPDKPSGRGLKLAFSPVKEYAISKNIPVFQPVKLKKNEEVLNILKSLNPDIIAVVAYGKILPKEVLEIPKLGSINVHGSLLPKYRGAAPMQWAIINGEQKTGITTMFMDEGMDTGDMLLKEEIEIKKEDNFETIHDKMKELGARLLVATLDKVVDGSYIRIKQPIEDVSIAPMISKDMAKIDFSKSPNEIFNFVRGLCPFPAAFMVSSKGIRYKVYKVEPVEDENIDIHIENGSVILLSKNAMHVKVQGGYIKILKIQYPNSKKMDIASFLAGNKINIDEIFK